MATRKKRTESTEVDLTEEQKAALAAPRSQEQSRLALKRKVRMYYDIQEMRLQAQGRLTKKAPGSEIDLHPSDIRKLEARLTDLQVAENNALKDLEEHLAEVPFYREHMHKNPQYKGLGPRMAGVVLASFDIAREDTPSKMWAFAGLAPIPALRCTECSVVVDKHPDRDMRDTHYFHPKPLGNKCRWAGSAVTNEGVFVSGKAMKPIPGEKLRYNKWLRTKLCGVLGEVLLKVGSPYRTFYDQYKHRKESAGWGTSPKHRHVAAIRYMIKMLLLDLWKEWRTFEGLPVRPSYQEEKLGHTHGGRRVQPFQEELSPEVAEELASLGEVC